MTPTPILEDTELQFVIALRAMSPQHQRDLLDIAERWAESDRDNNTPSPGRPYGPSVRKQ